LLSLPEHLIEVFSASPKVFRGRPDRLSGVKPSSQLLTALVRGSVLRHLSILGEWYERMVVVRRCCREAMPDFETDSETTR
jgi:hypothetical protein